MIGEEGFMPVRIGASDDYWIRNGRLFIAPGPADSLMSDIGASRQSGNVLLWMEDGVTYRFETALDRAPAVAIADGLVPMATPNATD